jgi:hypothetical protein
MLDSIEVERVTDISEENTTPTFKVEMNRLRASILKFL